MLDLARLPIYAPEYLRWGIKVSANLCSMPPPLTEGVTKGNVARRTQGSGGMGVTSGLAGIKG